MNNEKKVIGCFAHIGKMDVMCVDVDACLIADSQEKMEEYIKGTEMDEGKKRKFQIKKTRFGEIMAGIKLGAAYSFDENAYERFYPLAKENGIELKEWDSEEAKKEGKKYLTVRPK